MKKLALTFCLAVLGLLLQPEHSQAQTLLSASAISTSGADCTTATACVGFDVPNGMGTFTVYIAVGTTGTFIFEASLDATSNTTGTWFSKVSTADDASVTASGAKSFTNTGFRRFRVRASALSGTATVTAYRGGDAVATSLGDVSIGDISVSAQPASDPHYVRCSDGAIAAPCNVAITGTPAVTATITGTPAVTATISGTPTVTISGTPTVTGTVAVSGTVTTAGTSTVSGTVTANLSTTDNNVLDDIADGINVVCTSGCAGGTTDTDDGTVAGAQSTGLGISLQQNWNGSNWIRSLGDTVGTYFTIRDSAGNARGANVNSSNELLVNCSNCSGSGGNTDVDDGTVAGAQTANMSIGFGYSWNGSNWVRNLGNATDGLQVNLGANNDVTVTSGSVAITGTAAVTGTVTANAGTNLNTSALLTTTDFNSALGTAGTADSQVMSVQGIAAMTPLLVNPGTAANSGIYVEDATETAGANLAMAGTVRRDTATSSAGTSGDNATLNTDANGMLWTRNADPCSGATKSYFPVNIVTATTTEIVNALAANYVYICSINLFSAGAQNLVIVEDDSDTCASPGTGGAGLNGGTTAGTGYNFTAQTGIAVGNGAGSIMRTAAQNVYVCIITSAAVQVSGTIVYVQAP